MRLHTHLLLAAISILSTLSCESFRSTVMVDGKLVPRQDREFSGQLYSVRYEDAHPQADQGPSIGLTGDGGRVIGEVCGLDVTYNVAHKGDHVELVGKLENLGSLKYLGFLGLSIADVGGSRTVIGTIAERTVALRIDGDGISGGIGRRSFQLRRQGNQLTETFQGGNFNITLKLSGPDVLRKMPAAAQGAVLPLMLACLVTNFDGDKFNDQAEFAFGGPMEVTSPKRLTIDTLEAMDYPALPRVFKTDPGPECRMIGSVDSNRGLFDGASYDEALAEMRKKAALAGMNYVVVDAALRENHRIEVHGRGYLCPPAPSPATSSAAAALPRVPAENARSLRPLNAAAQPDTPVTLGKGYAVLFATTRYDDAGWPQLKTPAADASEIVDDLGTLYGFEVDRVSNPSVEDIRSKIHKLAEKKYADGDQLFIMFSGHGDKDELLKKGWIIARDTKAHDHQGAYPFSELREDIDSIPCKHILLILDVCFGGSFDPNLREAYTRTKEYSEASTDEFIRRKLRDRYIRPRSAPAGRTNSQCRGASFR